MHDYLIPDLDNEMYCGVDFWKIFAVAPKLISSLNINPISLDQNLHKLASDQEQILEEVKSHFF